jgi:ArsR family transcriptional regulator
MGSPEPVDALFQAFADRTRLRILNILREGELCVGDLVQILDVPQPTASRHLAQLRNAGLVATRRHGLWCFYSLAQPEGRLHERLLRCLECCFEEVPELASDLRTAAKTRRSGGCCPDAARGVASRGAKQRVRTSAETHP